MASELIEKIKVFLFFDPGRCDFRECCPRRRDRGVGCILEWGVGEWIPGNI